MPIDITLKRVYEPAAKSDGRRFLVERLWPRGVSKERARVSSWVKEVAPSPALRKWYGHAPEKWPEFRRRYRRELRDNPAVAELHEVVRGEPVTFLYAARDTARNSAVVLKAYLEALDR